MAKKPWEGIGAFIKRDLPERSELSWVCAVHKDPAAMRLVLRRTYVCTLCTRDGAHPA
ncbi:hypothetical protein AB0M57_34295 [Streptomyces sp. NPDC051597]|uniref:hypothetical protein n=1 Tax=Streptomyces sp. NPDC051597 TaxID=3155049 RepID=UPI0034216D5D